MKKIFYSIMVILALFSCQKFDIGELNHSTIEGKKVVVRIGVDFPEMSPLTKAFGDDPLTVGYLPLHIVVFDGDGMYVERTTATFVNRSPDDQANFLCTLTTSSDKRNIHMVSKATPADYPGTGYELFNSLAVEGNQDAYWQKIQFPDGIRLDENDSTQLSPATLARFTRIPMLRNYAQVTAKKAAAVTNFTITGLTVVNTLNKGTVAPYNAAVLNFVEYMKPGGGEKECKNYLELLAEGYRGNMPQGATLTNTPAALTATDPSFVAAGQPYYLYERTQPGDETNTFAIIRGRYGTDTYDTYYKIDLIYNEGGVNKFYHILRNFNYEIEITHVSARGSATAAEAAAGTAFNNLSADVQLKNLTNISDGTARLFVSYTDSTLNTTNDVKFKFKYYSNFQQGTLSNSSVTIGVENGNIFTGTVLSNTPITSGEWQGWNEVTLDVKDGALGALAKRQSIMVTAAGSGLSREIRYVLREKRTMYVTCDPHLLDPVTHANGDVHIDIPGDLDSTAFPLHFYVDTDTKSLYPRVDGPASGQIMPLVLTTDSDGRGSFAFQRTLTWEEYSNLPDAPVTPGGTPAGYKRMTCWMATNEGVTFTDSDNVTVTVSNKYFNDASDYFMRLPLIISGGLVNGEHYGQGIAISLVVTVNKINAPLKIELTEGLVGAGDYAGETTIYIEPTTPTVTIPLTSTTFGGTRTAVISHNVAEPDLTPVPVTVLANKFTNVRISGLNLIADYYNRNVYIDSGYQTVIGNFTLNTTNRAAPEITITSTTHAAAMTPGTTLYFSATRSTWFSTTTEYAQATAAQLLDPNFVLQFN